MNKIEYDKIISLYEDFEVYKGKLVTKKPHFIYVCPSSRHSGITSWAYGTAFARSCVDISDGEPLEIRFDMPSVSCRSYIKFTATLVDWKKCINHIKIEVNGASFYENDREFIENINLGWPTIYYPVSQKLLHKGENIITVSTDNSSESGLYVSAVDIVTLPEISPFSQVSSLRTARAGSAYIVAFSIPDDTGVKAVSCVENCKLLDIVYPKFGFCIIKYLSEKQGAAASNIEFENGLTVKACMPCIVAASEDKCLIGIDSDDHRHDFSDETSRIAEIFAMTAMGNYYQFRPTCGRNYYDFNSDENWKIIIDFLKLFADKIGIAVSEAKCRDLLITLIGESFFGCHIHEPYLYFCPEAQLSERFMTNVEAVMASESFGNSEKLYRDVLDRMYDKYAVKEGISSVGSPSMLVVCEAEGKYERVTIEPVSNINLLTAAVRGAKPKLWGAHVPTDWYFGSPNDAVKSMKFKTALYYLYLSGADYIYAENTMFKTNAFSREDWDDEFCSQNRQYLRDFYDFTLKNPRNGTLVVDKAIVYGRHEYFYWQDDDRIGELGERNDWDKVIWGKWKDSSYQKCWHTADAWLPIAEKQWTPCKYDVNKKLFSGTPYGDVDVISYEKDFGKYRALTFLGWNTMNDDLLNKVKSYVHNGGTVFISYCHFNYTDRNDREMTFPDNELTRDLLGLDVIGDFTAQKNVEFNDGASLGFEKSDLRIAKCKVAAAKAIAYDAGGNPIFYENSYGKGKIYFGAFMDYFCEQWAVLASQHVLEIIGSMGNVSCDNRNICFAMRKQADGTLTVSLMNMSCADNASAEYNLTINGKIIHGSIIPGEIEIIEGI